MPMQWNKNIGNNKQKMDDCKQHQWSDPNSSHECLSDVHLIINMLSTIQLIFPLSPLHCAHFVHHSPLSISSNNPPLKTCHENLNCSTSWMDANLLGFIKMMQRPIWRAKIVPDESICQNGWQRRHHPPHCDIWICSMAQTCFAHQNQSICFWEKQQDNHSIVNHCDDRNPKPLGCSNKPSMHKRKSLLDNLHGAKRRQQKKWANVSNPKTSPKLTLSMSFIQDQQGGHCQVEWQWNEKQRCLPSLRILLSPSQHPSQPNKWLNDFCNCDSVESGEMRLIQEGLFASLLWLTFLQKVQVCSCITVACAICSKFFFRWGRLSFCLDWPLCVVLGQLPLLHASLALLRIQTLDCNV